MYFQHWSKEIIMSSTIRLNKLRQERFYHWLPFIGLAAFLLLLLLMPDQAHASTAGTGLEWESPLKKISDSIRGPVAFAIALLGVIGCGATLIWGGEINEFIRRMIMVVLVISIILGAADLLSTLFTTGAVIPMVPK